MSSSPPETHVRLVPFEMLDRRDKVLVGRDGGADWIVLDPAGAEILAALDRGVPVEALEGAAPLVRELEAIGFVASIGAVHAGSSRVAAAGRGPRSSWPWRAFAGASLAAVGLAAWAYGSGRAPLPSGADLLLSGLPVPIALAVLVATLMATSALHELAHVLAGRHFGLRPRVQVGARVARTDLHGIWALEPALRWRPLAAGMMVDAWILAAAALAGAPMVAASVLSRTLWQLQYFLRTDVHFLFAALTGALNLRETVGLMLRRSPRLAGLAPSEVRAARAYVALLPLAAAATVALWLWMLVPLARSVA